MTDPTFLPLLPHLQYTDRSTLWLADENALDTLKALDNNGQSLHIATNRFDIFQLAQHKRFSTEFNDFALTKQDSYPQRILYRISKEKPITHHLLNLAAEQLQSEGELIISGQKQEGIKTYADKVKKIMGGSGTLTKNRAVYSGVFTGIRRIKLDAQDYEKPRKVIIKDSSFYSKPGIFGWNKIDAGTELLLECIPEIIPTLKTQPHHILDLGCGYGWIFLNLPKDIQAQASIIATDNNAAALQSAQYNAKNCIGDIQVIPSDCANTISQQFDLIISNPPFHQGFQHDKNLTKKFLEQALAHLNTTGTAIFVINEFIRLPALPSPYDTYRYLEHRNSRGYKVVIITHH